MYEEDDEYEMGMSEEELLYREMNPDDPWYMGPSDDENCEDEDYDCDDW